MKGLKHAEKFKTSHLKSGESVITWTDGYIGKMMGKGKDAQRNGVLLVTDIRVAFYRKGLLGEVIETIPLKSISSIERRSLLGHRAIKIFTTHDSLEFKTFSKEGELMLIDAIEAGRGLKAEPLELDNSKSTEVNDPYDQLRKLSELKNAGIISEEEFQAKKTKLMDLI
jgi:hypothetical protein